MGMKYSDEMQNQMLELGSPRDDTDTLRQAMRHNFNPVAQDTMVRLTAHAFRFGPILSGNPVLRPSWYFDLSAIIHPALTIDGDLIITACSRELCTFLHPVYPNLQLMVDSGTLTLEHFLRGLGLFHFDYKTLEPSTIHVLDPTAEFPGLLTQLAANRAVDKKPAFLKLGELSHYLELSFALQVAFPGAQSIWHIVDKRVGQMNLVRAMRLTKWFITAHRLKQPTNLFNIARATLQLLLSSYSRGALPSEAVTSEISDAIGSLSAGIEEFSRFVMEISGDEYKLVTSQYEDWEVIDLIAVLQDVATDIDFIYAKPSGVNLTFEPCQPEDMGHFIRGSAFLLREAFFNIVHNAFKHGAKRAYGPTILIRCKCSESSLTIDVEDNGPGMSARELREYSSAFDSIDLSINPSAVGALSGLSLAMSVIKSCNGTMFFSNMQPTGFKTTTTFTSQANGTTQ